MSKIFYLLIKKIILIGKKTQKIDFVFQKPSYNLQIKWWIRKEYLYFNQHNVMLQLKVINILILIDILNWMRKT